MLGRYFVPTASPAASSEFCNCAASSLVPVRSIVPATTTIIGSIAMAVAMAKLPRSEGQKPFNLNIAHRPNL